MNPPVPPTKSKGIPKPLAHWLGSFAVAAINAGFKDAPRARAAPTPKSIEDEQKSSSSSHSNENPSSTLHLTTPTEDSPLISVARLLVTGPLFSLATWRAFSHILTNGGRSGSAGFLASISSLWLTSLASEALTKRGILPVGLWTERESVILNRVLWLRLASSFWSILTSQSERVFTLFIHMAISVSFYAVMKHPHLAQTISVRMAQRFLSRQFFEGLKEEEEIRQSASSVPPGTIVKRKIPKVTMQAAFTRAFRELFIYNFALHYIAAAIQTLVRRFGRSVSKDAVHHTHSIYDVMKRATREAFLVNLSSAMSCACWVTAGNRFGILGAALIAPIPLWLLTMPVKSTFYFLFVPWAARYLDKLSGFHQVDVYYRLVSVCYLLESRWFRASAPLAHLNLSSSGNSNSDSNESFAWLIGAAFGIVQRAMSNVFNFQSGMEL